MKQPIQVTFLAAALLASGASLANAQLPPPNEAGVTMGHLHILARDVAAHTKLWVEGLGARTVKLGVMDVLLVPGAAILIREGTPTGGSEGSTVDHLGFLVRDLKAAEAKWKAAGGQVYETQPSKTQLFLRFPDEVKVELSEDPALSTPIAHHHIHFSAEEVEAARTWYVKTFGAKPGRRGRFEAADLPGANLSFSPAKVKPAGTKGRAVDHIGFEIDGLEAFCRRLEQQGIRLDVPYRTLPKLGIAVAFLTDPWGTYIELTEGLDKLR